MNGQPQSKTDRRELNLFAVSNESLSRCNEMALHAIFFGTLSISILLAPSMKNAMSRDLLTSKSRSFRTIRYFHTDQTGLSHQLTDASGCVQWSAVYSAWGEMGGTTYCNDNRKAPWRSGIEYVHQPLRFQGQYFDIETGLHYNQHRFYDPDTGRFVTQDPLRLRGGICLYRYAPNPNRWIDPLGLQGVDLNLYQEHPFGSLANYGNDVFSIVAHGNQGCIAEMVGNTVSRYISPEELAEMVRNSPTYRPGQEILLAACGTGSGDNPFAQQLSNRLNAQVVAPTGGVVISTVNGPELSLQPGFNWKLFVPCGQ